MGSSSCPSSAAPAIPVITFMQSIDVFYLDLLLCLTDVEAERLGRISLRDTARAVAQHEVGSTSEEGQYEDGELQEGVNCCNRAQSSACSTSTQSNRNTSICLQGMRVSCRILDISAVHKKCLHLVAGYDSDLEEEGEADKEEKPAPQSRPARKILEPFEVPMSGTFWMHDDRGGDDEEGAEG